MKHIPAFLLLGWANPKVCVLYWEERYRLGSFVKAAQVDSDILSKS